MDINKVKTYLGFANKAGKIVFGIDNIIKRPKGILVVLYDSTLAQNSVDKVTRFCETNNIPCILYSELIIDAVHKQNCKIVGITDKSLAEAILLNLVNCESI